MNSFLERVSITNLTCTSGFEPEMIKNTPANAGETRVQFLVQKDPLEEEMAIHSSILAWKHPWTEDLGGLQSMGSQRVRPN